MAPDLTQPNSVEILSVLSGCSDFSTYEVNQTYSQEYIHIFPWLSSLNGKVPCFVTGLNKYKKYDLNETETMIMNLYYIPVLTQNKFGYQGDQRKSYG